MFIIKKGNDYANKTRKMTILFFINIYYLCFLKERNHNQIHYLTGSAFFKVMVNYIALKYFF